MEDLLSILLGTIFNPIYIIIIVVVILIVADSRKKNKIQSEQQRQIAEGVTEGDFSNSDAMAIASDQNASPAPAPVPPKPKNPMTKWNWLLYIGSFLIVLAMIYFVDSVNDAAVAPTTIILTLIIYAAGLAITKAVGYLKPVGKAFTYSGLCMIPLWLISLEALKLPSEVIPLIVTISFSIASIIASFVLNDAFLGYVVFLSVATFIGSFCPLFFARPTTGVVVYFFFVAPMIAALAPLYFWVTKPKWLPVAFRHASMGLGKVLIPMVFVCSLLLFLTPDVSVNSPFLRTVCSVFFTVHCLAHWFSSKKHSYFVLARFAVQSLILAVLCDSLNFSMIHMWYEDINYASALACAIVWLITFLAQVIYSLYANCEDEKDKKLERTVGLISIIGIFATPVLCAGFDKIPYAIVWIVICIVTAILGILHAMRYKNVTWSLATVASILILPAIYGINIAKPSWGSGAYMACYSVIGLIFLFGYYAMQRIQKHESDIVGIVAIAVTSAAIIVTSIDANFSGVGYLIVAGLIAALASLSKQKWLYELSIYATAMSLFSFAGNVYDLAVKGLPNDHRYSYSGSTKSLEYGVALTVARAHIIMIAFGLTSWLYEREKGPSAQARLIIGYSLFTLVMSVTCTINNSLGWGILLLIEQVVALMFAVMTHRTWMTWVSSIAIFLIALRLTGGFNFIWLGIIGIALIAFVIWQLSKQNKKLTANNDPNTPALPEAQGTPTAEPAPKEEKAEPEETKKDTSSEKEEATDESKDSDAESKKPEESEKKKAEPSEDNSIPEDVLWDLDNRSKFEPEDKNSDNKE